MVPQLKALREQRQHWRAEASKIRGELASLSVDQGSLRQAEESCNLIRGRLQTLSDEEKREFLRLALDAVWVDGKGKIEIVGTIPSSQTEAALYTNCETSVSWKERGKEIRARGHP